MSGSGGGGDGDWRSTPVSPTPRSGTGGGAGGGEERGSDPCDVYELTTLNSPDRSVLSTLRAGDVLEVVFQAGPPRLLLARRGASTAGSITSPSLMQIIQCISERGLTYAADVVSIRGAICQVRVRRV